MICVFCRAGDPKTIDFGAMVMSPLNRELVYLILQFLDEEKFKGTMHK